MSPDLWLKIEAVFQEAADLPPHERAQFLDRKCGSDVVLRAEVEKLLAHDDAAGDFIESPVWSESALFTTTSKKKLVDSVDRNVSANGGDDLVGRQIGVWRLTRELGRGGMGAVYLAERSDGEFRQRAAIKLIKRGMDSDFIIRRFRHERQILASFEHPFIARLLDGGTTSEGVPYFVMEYIEGDTLYNYCDSKGLSIRDRLRLFQKICSAIQYAHERQIVHRDIKPGNILISRGDTPKLLDFGIAKILDTDLIHESVNPTASMLRMMTPDYASPEQVRGVEVTPASDIYSLGILLYELLTGHRPYNFEGRSLHEVSRVICEVPAIIPSKVIFERANLLYRYSNGRSQFLDTRRTDQKQLVQELERNLDDLVMKAIAKAPADRYTSAKDLSEDISRHLNGSRVAARPYVEAKQSGSTSTPKIKPDNRSLAVLPFKYLNLGTATDTDDGFLGLGLADALIARLSKIRRFTVRPTGSILSFNESITDPVKAGQALNVDFILDGNIKRAGDRLRVSVQLLNVKSNAAIWATSIDETVS
ncbi:MAG TPA: serine/threonine-protein kinase, partial [Pyrinomonadaceae bacterium]|nr:serine/threonine-protein kinase [Pyrinomonadaceae bacterium]